MLPLPEASQDYLEATFQLSLLPILAHHHRYLQ